MAAVFAFHAGILPGGFLGVDVFFAISGYLITALALAEIDETGRLSLRAFWARRARRLLPALYAVVGAVIVAAWTTETASETLRRDVIATVAYVANWVRVSDDYDYFAAYESPSPLEHTWSLAVEEQFYVVWPIVLVVVALVARRYRRDLRRAVAITAATLGAGSVAWSTWLVVSEGATLNRLYFGTDTRSIGLAAGCVAACLLSGPRAIEVPRRLTAVGAVGGTVTLVALVAVLDGSEEWLYGPGFLIVAGASVAIVHAAATGGTTSRLLAAGPLPSIGRVSYGIYLWHWPVMVYLDAGRTGLDGPALGALWVTATAALTAASWWLVERPAPLPTRPTHALAYTGAAIAVLAATSVVTAPPEIDRSLLGLDTEATATPASTVTSPSASVPIPSDAPEPAIDASNEDAPTTAPANAPATVTGETPTPSLTDGDLRLLVLGDSVAESLGAGATVPLVVDGREITVANSGIVACPVDFAGRWAYDSGQIADDPIGCDSDDRFDDVVAATDPDVLLLLFGHPGTIAGRLQDDGRVIVGCQPEHDRAYGAAFAEIADRYGLPTAAATVPPPQEYRDPSQSDRPACLNSALRATGLPLVELSEWLCPGDDCAPAAALRRDAVHFSADPAVRDLVWQWLVEQTIDALAGPGG